MMPVVTDVIKRGLLATGHYARTLRQLSFPGVAVLCYHGVRPEGTSPAAWAFGGLHVTASELEAHSRLLRELCHPISLAQWRAALAGGPPLPPRPSLITFDDGYRTVFSVARPILARWQIPAVIFLCSGPIARRQLHWYDAMALARGEAATEQAKRLPHEAWRAQTAQYAQHAHDDDPQSPLTLEEVKQLAATDGIEIGGHTVSHPILACAPLDQQRQQIVEDKSQLEAWSGRPVRAFAYPNGRAGTDFTDQTVGLVREAGFDFAFTTRNGFALPAEPLLERSRLLMLAGVTDAELAHRLCYGPR